MILRFRRNLNRSCAVVKENIGLSDSDYNELINGINVVINSGALVKHFGLKKLFEDINVTGTKNIVNFCLHNAKRLIHCSTISVSGFGDKNEFTITPNADESRNFSEQDLFINQDFKRGLLAVVPVYHRGEQL